MGRACYRKLAYEYLSHTHTHTHSQYVHKHPLSLTHTQWTSGLWDAYLLKWFEGIFYYLEKIVS